MSHPSFQTSFDNRHDNLLRRAYPSKEREARLNENSYRSQIQRKGHKNKPISRAQMKRNHRIAKSRARVEHVFAGIEQMGGKLIQTIGQATQVPQLMA